MDIDEQRFGAVTVLKPVGSLALDEVAQFKSRLADAMVRALGRVAVDASAISYVDSKALEVLVEASDQLAQSGRALRLCGVNELLREVLDLTELADRFELYEDASAAARSFL
jgi:anti-anti-sigma factor